jgi:hypothetical protein
MPRKATQAGKKKKKKKKKNARDAKVAMGINRVVVTDGKINAG